MTQQGFEPVGAGTAHSKVTGCSGLLVFNTLDTTLQDFLGSNTVRNAETVSRIR